MKWLLLMALIASLGIAGCVDEKQELIINPDGSGKVFYKVNYYVCSYDFLGIHSYWKDEFRDDLKSLLERSDGIDAWKDVSYKVVKNDSDCDKTYYRIHIAATAYFPDINKVEINGIRDDSKEMELKLINDSDQAVIEFFGENLNSSSKNAAVNKKTVDPNLTDEQIDEQIQKIKAEWQKGMDEMMQEDCLFLYTNTKYERVLCLPGKVVEVTNVTKVDDNTVRLYFDFDKIMKVMDSKMRDETYLRNKIKKGEDPEEFGDKMEVYKMLFGQAKPLSVTFKVTDKMLFDYQAEMQAAKSEFTSMKETLYAEFDEVVDEQLGMKKDKKVDVNDLAVK